MNRRIVAMLGLLVAGEIGVFYVEHRDVVAMNESADALVLDGRFPDTAQAVLARDRVSRRLLERVADVAQRRHDVALQVVALERIVSSAPGDTEARLRLAQALRDAGRFDEAERIYRQELHGLVDERGEQ
jgi:Flp pilus assembly protein TadD